MVTGARCPACGLMQLARPTCRACGSPLGGSSPLAVPPQGVPGEDPGPPRRPAGRKVLVLLGAGLLVLLGWGIIGFGALTLWKYGSGLDAESKAYVDEVVPKILSSWNPGELLNRASPELIAATPSGQAEKLFRAFAERLGTLKHYEGGQGGVHVFVSPQTGKVTTATYLVHATFEKARASIQVRLIWRDGRWQILGFHLNSDALIP